MTSIATAVYQSDGTTLIATVPRRRNVQFLHELNGDGSGQFDIHLDDAVLAAHPTLLDGGNIVKMRPTIVGAPVFGWQIEETIPALTPQGQKAERFCQVRGRGLRTLLASATLYPEYGIAVDSADDRGFSFASATASWPGYVSADWVAPLGVRQDADPTARSGNPVDWPDGAAQWLWSTSPTGSAVAGRNWFRSTFTVAAAGPVGIYASADNIFQLSLNGDVVLESDPANLYAWKQMFVYTATLQAGTYTLAARVDNATGTGSNPAGFLATVATLDGSGIPVTVLRRTDTTNWLVHGYPPAEPGWHAASIIKKCIAESQARSEAQIVPLTLGFSDTIDTDSVAWTDIQSERFPIGSDLLTILSRCIELGIDAEISPSMVVNAWKRRGTDLSATIRLLPGRDIVQNIPTRREGALRNSALVRHGTGWVLVEDAASITAHGRRSTLLTLGGADSATQATQQAQAFFDESAHPQITLPISMTSASSGPQPYLSFGLGDTITAPGTTGLLTGARVMSIAASEGDGTIAWDLDLYPEVT